MSLIRRFFQYLGGGATYDTSGTQTTEPGSYAMRSPKTVNEETSLQTSSVWACVNTLSGIISNLPIKIYTKRNGVWIEDNDHPLNDILVYSPNKIMTSYEWRQAVMLNYTLHGNGYSEIQRNQRGKVIAIWPLSSLQMKTIRKDHDIEYEYTSDNQTKKYKFEDIHHLKTLGNGYVGQATMGAARNAIALALASEEYGANFYLNGGKVDAVIRTDQVLTDEQRKVLRKRLDEMAKPENSQKSMVLEGGLKREETQLDPEKMQMNTTRANQVDDIARFFGIPSILINANNNVTTWGTGIEQIILGWLKTSLNPLLSNWEQSLEKSLFTLAERKKHKIRFDTDELERGDFKGFTEGLVRSVQGGIRTPNEARQKIGLKDVEGGDKLHIQQNMSPIDELSEVINQ